ncbi:hypothetical protein [Tenacibaculum sediminilitoris]|uniref:hypothetical protein n=1 Tax=Tenacibaculum sediminilitoris TaxID=1820334 RepID=UPI0038B59CA9
MENRSSTTVNYIQNSSEISEILDITSDGYGSETSWKILDSSGGVVKASREGDFSSSESKDFDTNQFKKISSK